MRDDGVGGADPAGGTGLTGLADRVAAVDGRLLLSSPPGGPTWYGWRSVRADGPLRIVLAEDSVLLREGLSEPAAPSATRWSPPSATPPALAAAVERTSRTWS